MYRTQIEFLNKLTQYFPNVIFFSTGPDFFLKIPNEQNWNILFFLKHFTYALFKQLIDLSFVDYPERKLRFELFYNLLSVRYNSRLTVLSSVSEDSYVDSVTAIYPSAGWYEREAWDMFGVFFKNHPDLRRILTDYGFKGHPLRKDFPLTGYIEVRYDDFNKRIVYEEVSLTQEYRVFTLDNSWNNIKVD